MLKRLKCGFGNATGGKTVVFNGNKWFKSARDFHRRCQEIQAHVDENKG